MAASMVGPVVGSNEVARCLYALTLMDMQHITSGDSGSMNLRVITLGHAQSAIVTMTLTYLSQTCDSHSVYVTRQKNSPRSSSQGQKSRAAFANSAIWQFRSQMATELIT